MNNDIKKLWVDSLKSGKYKQCKRYLKHGDCFCVFGVLLDILKDRYNGKWINDFYHYTINNINYKTKFNIPFDILSDIGLHDTHIFLNSEDYVNISVLNDILGLTFDNISDLIENQL